MVQLSTAIEETVRVTVDRDLVDVDVVGNLSKFTDEFVDQLPVPGRFYQNLLTLAPGVKDADGDGNPNVHRARTRDFRALVNGVSKTSTSTIPPAIAAAASTARSWATCPSCPTQARATS